MIELVKKQGEYILYEDNDEFILSVVCGTIALYDIEVGLTEQQKERFLQEGQVFIELLAEEIRYNPSKYKNRISIFESTDLMDVEFFEILGERRETLYVGRTIQSYGIRYDQHRKDPKKAGWRNKMEGVMEISINGQSGPFKMTPYEAAVVEMYEINVRGGS